MTNPCLSIVPAGKLGTALQIALTCINATQVTFIHTPSFTRLTLPVLTPTKYKAISPLKSNLLCYPVIPSYEFKFFIIISLKKHLPGYQHGYIMMIWTGVTFRIHVLLPLAETGKCMVSMMNNF